MSDEEKKDAKVLAAAKKLVRHYLRHGKEYDYLVEDLAKAAIKRWPELDKIQ